MCPHVICCGGIRESPLKEKDTVESNSREALDLPGNLRRYCLAVLLIVCAALLAKQIIFARIATPDACGFYLPLAQQVSQGNLDGGQHVIIPPLYPILTGMLAGTGLLDFSSEPVVLSGRLISAMSVLLLVGLTYLLGNAVFNSRVGVVMAGLAATSRTLIYYGANAGPESLYGMFMTALALSLVVYVRTPRWWWALAVGACAALAALSRSEGIVFVPVAILVLVVGGRWSARAKWHNVGMHVLLILVVVGAIWLPRILFIHAKSGHYVLDIRMVYLLFGERGLDDISVRLMPLADATIPTLSQTRTGLEPQSLGKILDSIQESIFYVLGPIALVMTAAWFVFRKRLGQTRGTWVLLVIALVQILVVIRVSASSRYLVSLTGIIQVWGSLGIVAVAEALRAWKGKAARLGESLGLQLGLLGALLVAQICWSVLSRNTGVRNLHQKEAGVYVKDTYGPGQKFLGDNVVPTFYADGRMLKIWFPVGEEVRLDMNELAKVCQENQIRFILLDAESQWCPELLEQLQKDSPARQAVIKWFPEKAGQDDEGVYLLDANLLISSTQPS